MLLLLLLIFSLFHCLHSLLILISIILCFMTNKYIMHILVLLSSYFPTLYLLINDFISFYFIYFYSSFLVLLVTLKLDLSHFKFIINYYFLPTFTYISVNVKRKFLPFLFSRKIIDLYFNFLLKNSKNSKN